MLVLNLTEIQPTQLYISSAKLAAVMSWIDPANAASIPPVPIKRLGNEIICTDGHTRAFAAHMYGLREIPVEWDRDQLDWEAYDICVSWCKAEGVYTVADLVGRVIGPEEYEVLWRDRCHAMHEQLATRRRETRAPDTDGTVPEPLRRT